MKHASTTHRIDLKPAQRYDAEKGRCAGIGQTLMFYEGRPIGSSRQPLYAAARYLLEHDLAAPSDIVATFRGDTPSLSGVVGQAARLAVEETNHAGLRLIPYRPLDRPGGPMAFRKKASQKRLHSRVDGHNPAPLPV